jgi:hypothetical protein
MYRDVDEVESFRAEAPVLAGRLRALMEHLGITTAPRYRIKEVPRPERLEFKAVAEIFFRSRVLCRHKRPAFRASHSDTLWLTPPSRPSPRGSIAKRVDCSTPSTISCPIGRRINSRPMGEEGYPQDGDGAPPRCDGGAKHSSNGCSARDRDSPHPAAEREHHHPRLHEDGRGSGQRPLRIRHRHLVNHLLGLGFRQGACSEQSLSLRVPHSLGATQVMARVVSCVV